MSVNIFDFLRFLFAMSVLISHSYPLSINEGNKEFLYLITNEQLKCSSVGLAGFFSISGYLIYQSFERSKSIVVYLWKRILRLFPALIIVLLLTIVLVSFVYHGDIPYYKKTCVYSYFFRNVSLYNLQYSIEGVFETNPYPNAINGSLWTICYEFTMYCLICVLYLFKKHKKLIKFLCMSTFIFMYVGFNFFMEELGNINLLGLSSNSFLELCTYFVLGSTLAVFKIEDVKNRKLVLFVASGLLLFSIYFNFYSFVKHILLPVIIIIIGLQSVPILNRFSKYGDLSYGIYIYSFPIQQTLMYFFELRTFSLMIYSTLISLVFGYLSWHLVEKKALSYKNFFQFN